MIFATQRYQFLDKLNALIRTYYDLCVYDNLCAKRYNLYCITYNQSGFCKYSLSHWRQNAFVACVV